MASLFESLAAVGVLEPDDALLAEIRTRIDEEVRKLDEKNADDEENLGEIEVSEAHLAKSLYFLWVREKVLGGKSQNQDTSEFVTLAIMACLQLRSEIFRHHEH